MLCAARRVAPAISECEDEERSAWSAVGCDGGEWAGCSLRQQIVPLTRQGRLLFHLLAEAHAASGVRDRTPASAEGPAPFGSPVVAKFTQYAIIVRDSARSTSVHGRFSTSSVPKTYGTSDVWNAPNSGCSGHGIARSK